MNRTPIDTRPLQVLSLGAGIQSSTLLLMSCQGQLPKLDAAVFADTQWESPQVYAHLAWLEGEAKAAGIPLLRVSAGNLREATMHGLIRDGQREASMPLFVLSPDGKRGQIRRQCTHDYKLVPIERCLRRDMLRLRPYQIAPVDAVDQWIGISADELHRANISREHWRRNVWPLLGLPEDAAKLDRPYTRLMCRDWLAQHYPGRNVPRSSCLGCPFHRNAEWVEIKRQPALWADVCEVDEAIRNADKLAGTAYLHEARIPLRMVDLNEDQQTLGFEAECLGLCGT